jgi:hypothetical protein
MATQHVNKTFELLINSIKSGPRRSIFAIPRAARQFNEAKLDRKLSNCGDITYAPNN